jgi:hypothetical protein
MYRASYGDPMHTLPATIDLDLDLDLDDLHHRVAADGVEANWTVVATVMAASRAHPGVLAVLADPTEPEIVRQRAYARAVTGLVGAERPGGPSGAVHSRSAVACTA